MPYIGNQPAQLGAYAVESFNGGGSSFTLSKSATTETVLLFIDGVRQTPTDAYSVSGTTLTTTATTPSGTNNVTVQFLGDVVDFGEPSDNSVTSTKIVDGTIVNADINASAAIVGSKLANPLDLEDGVLQRPELKDYSETVNAIGSTGGGTQDIDLTLGNVVSATVDTSANTFTFSNPPTSGKSGSFTLILTNGGSQTVNWPASVDWAGGTAPTLTTAGVDVLTFTTVDGGTTWYGFAAGLDMK